MNEATTTTHEAVTHTDTWGGMRSEHTASPSCDMRDDCIDALNAFEALYGEIPTCAAPAQG